MVVVYASASVTPPPVTPAGFGQSWTGWDGSVWSLSSRADGLILGAGSRGFGAPAVQHFEDESPAVSGSRWRSVRTLPRDAYWVLSVLHGAGQDWVLRDRAFWRTMDPEQTGVWRVTQPNGEWRELTCRWREGEDGFEVDPSVVGWARYGIGLRAEDPFWRGPAVVRSWESGATAAYFSASGSVYTRSVANLLGSATLTNPGDVPGWVSWTITASGAGITTATVGVGGRVIVVPIALAAGESVTIDTAPADRRALRETGTDVTSSLGAVDFAPIPAGEGQTLSLSVTGTGTVSASMAPGYRRAW